MIETSLSSTVIVGVFLFTYVGMALGRVPGLRLERTGIALVAVAALLATGTVDLGFVGAAQDVPTLALLFALMIVSAQLSAAGFYDVCARHIAMARLGPGALLALIVLAAGVLSAVLTNDVVVFAIAPLLCRGLQARGLDPRPYLLGLAGGSNAGSAATIIGNPQNILIGEVGGLNFWHFVAVCGPAAAIALVIVFLSVRIVWRNELAATLAAPGEPEIPAADRWQIGKGLLCVVVLIALFATPVPRAVAALGLAALLLISRRFGSRETLAEIDWHLLLLFACLFTVTASFAETGLAKDALTWLAEAGLLPGSLAVLAPLSLLLSNGIGNVPAVILITAVWPDAGTGALYGLALLSTLAGNLLLVGSLANLIVAERARAEGVYIGFADYARAGVPMTLASMAVAVLWLAFGGWMPWSM